MRRRRRARFHSERLLCAGPVRPVRPPAAPDRGAAPAAESPGRPGASARAAARMNPLIGLPGAQGPAVRADQSYMGWAALRIQLSKTAASPDRALALESHGRAVRAPLSAGHAGVAS